MTFTGRLGTSDSELGSILLGSPGGPAIIEAGFTADAVISPSNTSITDFTSDFGDWVHQSGDTEVDIVGGVLVAPPTKWRAFDYTGDDTWRTGFGRYDFYVPEEPDNGYHAYSIDFAGLYAYMDNQSFTGYTGGSLTWEITFPGSLPPYQFNPDGDTWYSILIYVNNVDDGEIRLVIWPRDEPIPVFWDYIEGFPTEFNVGWMMYIDAADFAVGAENDFESRLDNVILYPSSDPPFENEGTVADDFSADALLVDTHYNAGTVGSGFTGTTVTVANGTSITLTAKGTGIGEEYKNQLGFVAISIDALTDPSFQITPPAGWQLLQRTRLIPGDDQHLVTFIHRWHHSEANTVQFTWSGNRSAVGVAWTASIIPADQRHHIHVAVLDAIADPTYSTASRGFDNSARSVPRASWAAYTAFAGASSGTWSSPAETFQFSDSSTTWASLSVNRDDFNTIGTAIPNYFSTPSNSQPPLAQIIIVTTDDTYFRANAVLKKTISATFTANSWLELPFFRFTANAVIHKNQTATFTANALIVNTLSDDFTADAIINRPVSKTFTANAVLKRGPIVVGETSQEISRRVQMTVLSRPKLVLDTYMPPRIPDQPNEDPTGTYDPPCLPPCPGYGAGGSMNGWGSFKKSFTRCAVCDVYFRSDSEVLGQGSAALDGNYHCGCDLEHNRDEHTTRLWVAYPDIPSGQFRLRAKMSWDQNGPDNMRVWAYTVDSMPDAEMDECETEPEDFFNSGERIGTFIFVNEAEIYGTVILGQTQVKYQNDPSEMVVDPRNLRSNVIRFQLTDEDTLYNARFRAANLEWQ